MSDDYALISTEHYLGLQNLKNTKIRPFFVDFLSDQLTYRRQQISLRKELLARAMGVSPQHKPFIVDATAGFGRDGFILAALQYQVTLIERSPVVHALLQDGMRRALQDAKTVPIVERIRLIEADAIAWLTQLSVSERPDIIYLDPMFPVRQKSAAVKKEMVILQSILGECENTLSTRQLSSVRPEEARSAVSKGGDDRIPALRDGASRLLRANGRKLSCAKEDTAELFLTALACARKRVVVKRPRYAAPLGEHPSFSIEGKACRFDIYLV